MKYGHWFFVFSLPSKDGTREDTHIQTHLPLGAKRKQHYKTALKKLAMWCGRNRAAAARLERSTRLDDTEG